MELIKPVLAITMGDPASIGPEIVVKSAVDKRLSELCKPIIIGDAKTLEEAVKFCNVKIKLNPISSVREAKYVPGTIDVFDLKNVDLSNLGEEAREAGLLGEGAAEASINLPESFVEVFDNVSKALDFSSPEKVFPVRS